MITSVHPGRILSVSRNCLRKCVLRRILHFCSYAAKIQGINQALHLQPGCFDGIRFRLGCRYGILPFRLEQILNQRFGIRYFHHARRIIAVNLKIIYQSVVILSAAPVCLANLDDASLRSKHVCQLYTACLGCLQFAVYINTCFRSRNGYIHMFPT